jgi:hypothetical protein
MDSTLLIALAIASFASIGLLFLPAIIELKKPADQGPRTIRDTHLRMHAKEPTIQVGCSPNFYACVEEDASLLEE